MRAAHGAEVRELGGILRQSLVVEFPGLVRNEPSSDYATFCMRFAKS